MDHRPRPDVLTSVAVGWAALAMPQELRAAAECNKREPAVVLPGLRSIVMKPTGSSGNPAARRPKTSCDHEAQHEASYWHADRAVPQRKNAACTLLQKY